MPITRQICADLDSQDALAPARALFDLPEGLIYLDGNSLGALPNAVSRRVAAVVREQWGRDLIRSWNAHNWISLPERVGARIAGIVGAEPGSVVAADSTSVNLFKLAAAALRLQAPRRVVLTEQGDFPTDVYILQGLTEFMGAGVELRVVERDRLAEALTDDVALLLLSHVHYKTAAAHPMALLCARARAVGALTLWDLSHSAGVLDVRLERDGADFAVGCGYKYINGGPGAPAFLYVAPRLQEVFRSPLSGWMGHARPFGFEGDYQPAPGVLRGLCGTPPVLSLAALDEALGVFEGLSMSDLERKARALGDLFIALVEQCCPDMALASPRQADARGGHVSLAHAEGYPVMQALIAAGVIGDFRAPETLRFGFSPLYVRYVDVWDAVARLAAILRRERWREPRFHIPAVVT
ncbi:MAG: kynureninase [Proteobacteria bacterium]|nr:kynureninase [Pseudomonadota bacterium]MBW3617897.1 kynureninase [Pseudomonadota bacterium]